MPTSPLIRPLAANIVRVTHLDPAKDPPPERPWLKDVLLELPESEKNGSPITVTLQDGLCQAANARGEVFFSERAAPRLGVREKRPYLYKDIPQVAVFAGRRDVQEGLRLHLNVSDGESFYGWGEWFNAFERKTGRITLDNRNAMFGEQDHLTYSGLPFFISSKGYGFLLLNSFRSRWDISETRIEVEADGPGADYILIYGPSYKQILRSYTALTGRPPLLPRWGFGLWLTGYPQEHQSNVLEHIDQHREKKLPLDAVILDYHWEERFHNFKWRPALIPDPAALIAGMRKRGTRLGLILTSFLNTHNRPFQKWLLNTFGQNVTPGLERDDERALDEFNQAKAQGFLAHEHVHWWFGTGGMLDFTHPGAVRWWREKLQPLFEAGVDFIKNDDGEDLPDDARAFNGMDGREYHNIYGFYYGRATYEREPSSPPPPAAEQPRSLIYARTAWVGSQRYPALFLGDQEANFEGIRHSLRAGLNLAMGGFSYWTADVFGLAGKTSPEVHMRYAQWALLSPVARYFVRPAKIDDTRFPWSHNAQVEANFRKYSELRMRLLPYFNSLAHESHLSGLPIMRPPLLEFPQDARLRGIDDQIMLGESLLICPVTEAGATSRKIILPEGEWHDFWAEQSWPGHSTIAYAAPLERLPLLVRGGSILTLGPLLQNIPDTHVFDTLDLHCYPPYPAESLFFDDDGRSCAYRQGAYSRTRMRAEQDGPRLVIRISAAQGAFAGQVEKRQLQLILHQAGPLLSATLNKKPISAKAEAGLLRLQFEHTVNQDSLVEITFQN